MTTLREAILILADPSACAMVLAYGLPHLTRAFLTAAARSIDLATPAERIRRLQSARQRFLQRIA